MNIDDQVHQDNKLHYPRFRPQADVSQGYSKRLRRLKTTSAHVWNDGKLLYYRFATFPKLAYNYDMPTKTLVEGSGRPATITKIPQRERKLEGMAPNWRNYRIKGAKSSSIISSCCIMGLNIWRLRPTCMCKGWWRSTCMAQRWNSTIQ